MRSGRLRNKVALYAPTDTVSAMGEIETSYLLIGTFYASVQSGVRGEVADSGSLTSTTAYTIVLRYNSTDMTDLTPAAYFLFEGRKLQVRSVAFKDHRQRMIEIVAEEAR